MILITGAAGKTGQAIIRALAASGVSVRALVRDDSQSATVRLLGAREIVVGDMRESEIAARATMGVRVVYHICPNVQPDEVAIAQNFIEAGEEAGVQRFVYHSVLHPQTEKMPHHWRKLRVEELVLESLLPFTIVQPSIYMQNILSNWSVIKDDGVFPVPYRPQTRLNMVDLDDVGEAVAKILLEANHVGATYELAGPENLTQLQVASILANRLQRSVTSRQVSIDAWKQQAQLNGLGSYQIGALVKMFEYYDAFGFLGNSNVLARLLGRPPTTFVQFVRRQLRVDRQV